MSSSDNLFAEMLGMDRKVDERVPARPRRPLAPAEPQIDELEVQRIVVEEIAAEKAEIEARNAELESANAAMSAKVAALEAEKGELLSEKSVLAAEAEAFKLKAAELEKMLEDAHAENGELEEKLARMGRNLAVARRAASERRR